MKPIQPTVRSVVFWGCVLGAAALGLTAEAQGARPQGGRNVSSPRSPAVVTRPRVSSAPSRPTGVRPPAFGGANAQHGGYVPSRPSLSPSRPGPSVNTRPSRPSVGGPSALPHRYGTIPARPSGPTPPAYVHTDGGHSSARGPIGGPSYRGHSAYGNAYRPPIHGVPYCGSHDVHVERLHHYYRYPCSNRYFGIGFSYYSPPAVYVPGPVTYVDPVYPSLSDPAIQYVPVEQAPPSEPVTQPNEEAPAVRPLVEQGDAAFVAGKYDEARRLYIRDLLSNPDDPGTQLRYAWVQLALGHFDVAANALRRSLVADPSLLDWPPDPRGLYGNPNDFEAHRAALRAQAAETVAPRDVLFLLAYTEYATGEPRAGLAQLERVLALDDSDTLAYLLRDALVNVITAPASPTTTSTPNDL